MGTISAESRPAAPSKSRVYRAHSHRRLRLPRWRAWVARHPIGRLAARRGGRHPVRDVFGIWVPGSGCRA